MVGQAQLALAVEGENRHLDFLSLRMAAYCACLRHWPSGVAMGYTKSVFVLFAVGLAGRYGLALMQDEPTSKAVNTMGAYLAILLPCALVADFGCWFRHRRAMKRGGQALSAAPLSQRCAIRSAAP